MDRSKPYGCINRIPDPINMNAIVFAFAAVLAVARCGVIVPAAGVIAHNVITSPEVKSSLIQGPSTSTHIVGPDGSEIIAHAPGATIRTAEATGINAEIVAPVAPVAVVATPVVAAPIVAGPVVARALVASPLTGSGYPLLAPGSGLEGQYVDDLTEKLYDDGTYKGEIYA